MTTYSLTFTEQDLAVLDRLLQQAPYGVAAPLVAKINQQISEQREQPELQEVGEIRLAE